MKMKIAEAFNKLLNDLVQGNIISEDTKSKLCSEFEAKIDETSEPGDVNFEEKFKDELQKAVAEVQDKIMRELGQDSDGQGAVPIPPDENQDIGSLFKDFLSFIPKENLDAFNALVDSLTDDQKEKFKAFINGEFGSKPEETPAAPVEPVAQKIIEEPIVPANDELENAVDESVSLLDKILGKIKECDCEQDLIEFILNSGLREAKSTKLDALNRKYEREYAKLLQRKIREIGAENRSAKLTGGVVGKAKRVNDIGSILKSVRQELFMRESTIEELNDRIAAMEASRIAAEAEKRDLNERIKTISSDNDKLMVEVKKIKGENVQLAESIKTAESKLALNEAKAYLVEQTASLTPKLKNHLLNEFNGKSVEYVKKHLNEAVDAYHESEASKSSRLREAGGNNTSIIVSDAITESVENADKNGDEIVNSLIGSLGL
jgi:hypothetical protein